MRLRSLLSICAVSLLIFTPTPRSCAGSAVDLPVPGRPRRGRCCRRRRPDLIIGSRSFGFELFDDGQPQRGTSFSFVAIPLAVPAEFSGITHAQDVRSTASRSAASTSSCFDDMTSMQPGVRRAWACPRHRRRPSAPATSQQSSARIVDASRSPSDAQLLLACCSTSPSAWPRCNRVTMKPAKFYKIA